MHNMLCSLIIILICFGKTLFADTVCGDWQTYKEEKCFKVLGSVQSYEEAVNTCNQYNATLVTITSPEEQHFLENYLFTTLKVVENVWTGLKYTNTKYKWINDFDANYTNWAEHSPKNTSELCVQISSDDLSLGKWSDISCTKKNLALCQKLPTITAIQLMSLFINTRNELQSAVSQQNHTIQQLALKIDETVKQIDYLFSNKWITFKTFVENNKRKALIYPFKPQPTVVRSEAIQLCKQNNATLVDIESNDKQKIVELFLHQINPKLEEIYFYMGAYYESSLGKFKWFNSGNEINYTNLAAAGNPNLYPYYVISNNGDTNDGKWYHSDGITPRNVFCEVIFNI